MTRLDVLPSAICTASAPGIGLFRGSMVGLCAPLSTLRRDPRGQLRMTRGRCGSLHLHRGGLSPPTSCRCNRRFSGKGTATETGKGTSPKGSDTAKGPSGGNRVRLSEQQRSTVHSTILKESNVNRATNVNFSVSVGTRVPRSVHLVVLPASVLSIVPQYRSYEYFVANDQICIVDPSSYEIVEVISGSGRTAGTDTRGSMARLMLTEEEKEIILSEVGTNGGSTMGLGALSEGAEVPRGVQV